MENRRFTPVDPNRVRRELNYEDVVDEALEDGQGMTVHHNGRTLRFGEFPLETDDTRVVTHVSTKKIRL